MTRLWPRTGSGRGRRESRGPEGRDVYPAHEGDVLLLECIGDEVPDGGCAPGLPAPPGVDADRHQPCTMAISQFLEHVVEAELEAFKEVPGRGIRRGDQVPDVVMHLAVRNHKEGLA